MQDYYISSITLERNSVVLSAYHLFGYASGEVTVSLEFKSGSELEKFASNGHVFINSVSYAKQKTMTSKAFPYIFTIRFDSTVSHFPEG